MTIHNNSKSSFAMFKIFFIIVLFYLTKLDPVSSGSCHGHNKFCTEAVQTPLVFAPAVTIVAVTPSILPSATGTSTGLQGTATKTPTHFKTPSLLTVSPTVSPSGRRRFTKSQTNSPTQTPTSSSTQTQKPFNFICFLLQNGSVVNYPLDFPCGRRIGALLVSPVARGRNSSLFYTVHHGTGFQFTDIFDFDETLIFLQVTSITADIPGTFTQVMDNIIFSETKYGFSDSLSYIYFERFWSIPAINVTNQPCQDSVWATLPVFSPFDCAENLPCALPVLKHKRHFHSKKHLLAHHKRSLQRQADILATQPQ